MKKLIALSMLIAAGALAGDSPYQQRLIVCNSGKTLNLAIAKLNRRVNNPQLAGAISLVNESEETTAAAINAPYVVSSPTVTFNPAGKNEAVSVCVTVTAKTRD